MLGYFEDLGNYEKRGLLDINMIYDGFSSYLQSVWDSKPIQEYIKWLRSDEPDYYEGFEYIYKMIKEYEDAKLSGNSMLIWCLKHHFCKTFKIKERI